MMPFSLLVEKWPYFPMDNLKKGKKTHLIKILFTFLIIKKYQFKSHMLIFRGIFEQKIAMMTFQRK